MHHMASMVDAAREQGVRCIAIVGLAKNVGKTTAINALLRALNGSLTIGIASAGRDGEPVDLLTELPKPRIRVTPGTLVATGARALDIATASLNPLFDTGSITAMGTVRVAETDRAGRVELVGPATAGELAGVINSLIELGAELVLVDGAVDRRASAAPAVSDALVIATGAAVSPDMDLVVERTCLATELYQLPPAAALPETAVAQGAKENLATLAGAGIAVLRNGESWLELPYESALGLGDRLSHETSGSRAVYIGGALVESVLDRLLRAGIRHVIVRDATSIFINWAAYCRYLAAGGVLSVLHPTRLLGVTVNPWSPVGRGFPPGEFLEAVARAVAPVPVYDVLRQAMMRYPST